MATFTFSKPIAFEGVTYSKVEIPDDLEVGHQDFYHEFKDQFCKERLGIRLCAHMCEMPIDAFKKVTHPDFEKIQRAIWKLFPNKTEVDQKKTSRPRKD